MRLLAYLRKDARLLVRNRALLAALLAYPLLLALVLGAAFQEPPQVLDLAVVDEDASGATVDVGGTPVGVDDLLAAAQPFARVHRSPSEEGALHLLREGDVDAVLIIPPGFMEDLARLGADATLRVIVDESDPVRAGIARNAVEGAVDQFVDGIVQKKIDDVVELLQLTIEGGPFVTGDILGIDESVRRLEEVRANFDPASAEAARLQEVIDFLGFARRLLGNSESFLTTTAIPVRVQSEGLSTTRPPLAAIALPGALVLGVFWTGSLAAAFLAARERETGAHRRIAATPHARFAHLASKTLVALLAALAPAAVVLALAVALLGARVTSPGATLLALALAALVAAALGGLAAAIARSSGGAALLAVLALVPMLLLGGLFYPIAYMPAAAQAVAGALPVTLATDALRGAMIRGSPIAELVAPLGGLVATALLLAGSTWLFGRRAP